jgi:mitogen-activated protein kinase 1/3
MIPPKEPKRLTDVYLVLEYMQSDLHRVIHSENNLSHEHIAYIAYQIFCGLKYMHSAGVYHRDLKPGNILINKDCDVKICDFGLARGIDEDDELLTEYVVTRWYRAPEVVFNARRYSEAVDVWSVGCIIAEMYLKKPIFRGEDYADQIRQISKVLGTPTQEDFGQAEDVDIQTFMKSMANGPRINLADVVPTASATTIDLLEKIFVYDVEHRISVTEALEHPFFKKFYDAEFVASCVCTAPLDHTFEKMTRDKASIKDLINNMIEIYRPKKKVLLARRSSRASEKTSFFGRRVRRSVSQNAR